MKKTSKIEFKLDEELFQKYKSFCDRKGQTMSKRLRQFIEEEIQEVVMPIYDYNNELEIIKNKCREKINNISLIYFELDNVIREHIYIIQKNEEFILCLTNHEFLLKMNKKVLTNLMTNFSEAGKSTDYNILSDLIDNVRNGIKGIKDYHIEIENFYKNLKSDINI